MFLVQEHHGANSARAVLQIGPHEERIADSQRSLGRSHGIRLSLETPPPDGLSRLHVGQNRQEISGFRFCHAPSGAARPVTPKKIHSADGHHIVHLNAAGLVSGRLTGYPEMEQTWNQWGLSERFESPPLVPGGHTFLILHGIAEAFGLNAELA
jgi:hypothetical protein